jgi:hypothetical protein
MSRRLMYLACVALLALLVGTTAQAARDITKPGDKIQAVPNDGDWPGNEAVNQAIDDQIVTKYLHFKGDTQAVGLQVTPSVGPTVVTGVRFCSANDTLSGYPGRAPAKYELSGSNVSIDGPYTLIASGDIKDFGGATYTWPDRTWTTTPMKFANTVAYQHYQLMFTGRGLLGMSTNSDSVQIAEIELLMDVFNATGPNPADGKTGVAFPLLQWTPGDTATFEDVYVGTTPELTAADKAANHQPAILKMLYYIKPLVPGQKYYWRVDDFDAAGNVYTGNVWSFTAIPLIAYDPSPRNGDKWLGVDLELRWQPGQGATKHELYFGTDRAAVAARDASTFKGSLAVMLFDPGTLASNTTYYWAVDEIGAQKQVGDVWRFSTAGGGGGLKGEYFTNDSLNGLPALTRIDAVVDISTDASPGGAIPADGWSARWTADLEILFPDTYAFSVNCQDGTRLWIDGTLIIDRWVNPTVTSEYFAVPIHLEPGIHSLQLEFVDYGGTAVEQLYWSTATIAKEIIPAGPLQPPLRARAIYPANGGVDVPQEVTLVWSAGEKAAKHDVYFGDDADAVAAADPASSLYKGRQEEATFDPGILEWNKTYYWRVDEVNDAETDSPWQAGVWSFTTADFLVVDDFESYNDEEGTNTRIYENWIDGYADQSSGSIVGHFDPPFAEQTIVHSGAQSMPLEFDNSKSPYFSEAYRDFAPTQNWTVNGISELVLWVQGYPALTTTTVTETAGKMTLTGGGTDIWNNYDQFTFAYKTLNGDGSIVARVTSVGTGSQTWAKGGVMIRDSLDGGSTFANMVLTDNSDGAGGNGASFQYRLVADAGCGNTDSATVVAPPYWVKIERMGDTLTGYLSADGQIWVPQGASQMIVMSAPAYIGLCVTAHVATEQRTYQFDNIKTTGSVSGAWQGAIITAPRTNSAQPLYVTVVDSANKSATATNADAVNAATWTEVRFPLSDFAGVNMTKVKTMYIGVGDKANPVPDGAGLLYIDDIRVMKPAGQ